MTTTTATPQQFLCPCGTPMPVQVDTRKELRCVRCGQRLILPVVKTATK